MRNVELYMDGSNAWPTKLPLEYIIHVFEKARVAQKRELGGHFKEVTLAHQGESSGADETASMVSKANPEQGGTIFEPNPNSPLIEH